MADYVQSDLKISISEDCYQPAYYIHMGRLISEQVGSAFYSRKIRFEKRYRIDDRNITFNYFKHLTVDSWYDKSSLKLHETDSFLGSKIVSDDNTVLTSIIYSNEFFNPSNFFESEYQNNNIANVTRQLLDNYQFCYVTGKDVDKIPDIDIPSSYQYTYLTKTKERINAVSKILQNYDNTKWLYLIDCQTITNKYKSYIISFISTSSDNKDSINDITIKLHTIDEFAHLDNMSKFATDSSSQNYLSYFLTHNALSTTYDKLNGGVVSMNPLQHRLVTLGTPYGCSKTEFESLTKHDLDIIVSGKNSYFDLLTNYTDNQQSENTVKFGDEETKYKFGKLQMNYVDAYTGSYEIKSKTIEQESEYFDIITGKIAKSNKYGNIISDISLQYLLQLRYDAQKIKENITNNQEAQINQSATLYYDDLPTTTPGLYLSVDLRLVLDTITETEIIIYYDTIYSCKIKPKDEENPITIDSARFNRESNDSGNISYCIKKAYDTDEITGTRTFNQNQEIEGLNQIDNNEITNLLLGKYVYIENDDYYVRLTEENIYYYLNLDNDDLRFYYYPENSTLITYDDNMSILLCYSKLYKITFIDKTNNQLSKYVKPYDIVYNIDDTKTWSCNLDNQDHSFIFGMSLLDQKTKNNIDLPNDQNIIFTEV